MTRDGCSTRARGAGLDVSPPLGGPAGPVLERESQAQNTPRVLSRGLPGPLGLSGADGDSCSGPPDAAREGARLDVRVEALGGLWSGDEIVLFRRLLKEN